METRVGPLAVWVESPRGAAWGRAVLVHGLGEHSGRHANTTTALVGAGMEVVRFDLRGHGKSGGDRQWIDRFEDYVDDVVSVVDFAERRSPRLPVFLLGHSLGGGVAIHAAARLGDRLRGLALDAPAFEVGDGISPIKIAVGKVLSRFLPRARMPDAVDLGALSRDPAVAKAFAADPLCCRFNTLRQGTEILRALDEVPDRCRRIRVPVLITHGDQDRLVKVTGSSRALEAMGSADKTLEVFPGAYHELHNDLCKAEYLALLAKWLRAHAPGP